LAVDGNEQLTSRLGRFTLREMSQYPLNMRLDGHQSRQGPIWESSQDSFDVESAQTIAIPFCRHTK